MTFQPSWGILVVAGVVTSCCALAVVLRPRGGTAWRSLVAALMLVGVGLRPGFGVAEPNHAAAPVDVVIMVDRTTSMAAEDHDGNRRRLEGVAADVAALVERTPGARYCVIAFDNNARVVLPFSTDARAATTAVSAMGWREAFYGTGSDIGVGVDKAAEELRLSQSQGSRERYWVYAGDGEQTAETAPRSFAELKPLITGSLVLGYGTAAGGEMLERPGANTHVSENGRPVRSRIDENNLRAIAEQTGGRYEHRPGPRPPELGAAVAGPAATSAEPRRELLWPFGVVAAALLLVELGVGVRRWWLARSELL